MTLIVGIEQAGIAYMGCDSGVWRDGFEDALSSSKIFAAGPLLIGAAGNLRPIQVAKHEVKDLRPFEGDPERYVVTEFVPALRSALRDNGAMQEADSKAEEWGGTLLIACGGVLLNLASDFAVGLIARNYATEGHDIARAIALGVLASTNGIAPHERLRMALVAAADHTDAVRPPFHYLTQDDSRLSMVA